MSQDDHSFGCKGKCAAHRGPVRRVRVTLPGIGGYTKILPLCEAAAEEAVAREHTVSECPEAPPVNERDDLIAALRLAAEQYAPCETCGTPAAEWWHWDDSDPTDAPILTPYCAACVGDRKDDCSVAEPEDHIAAIAKVRHVIGRVHVDALAEMAAKSNADVDDELRGMGADPDAMADRAVAFVHKVKTELATPSACLNCGQSAAELQGRACSSGGGPQHDWPESHDFAAWARDYLTRFDGADLREQTEPDPKDVADLAQAFAEGDAEARAAAPKPGLVDIERANAAFKAGWDDAIETVRAMLDERFTRPACREAMKGGKR